MTFGQTAQTADNTSIRPAAHTHRRHQAGVAISSVGRYPSGISRGGLTTVACFARTGVVKGDERTVQKRPTPNA